jgi:hypothetical protein
MDKEQARFILRSFRPDGADAADPDFAEALRLAMENRELGEWLSAERAFDSAFASALVAVDLPEQLREDIMACMAAERGDFPQAEDGTDAAWIGALATIQPPATLRDDVLAAMDRTATREEPSKVLLFRRRVMIPLAAAAGIALAFLATRGPVPPEAVATRGVSIEVVKAGFIEAYNTPGFALEHIQNDKQVLINHLKNRDLPCPSCLPPGLQNVNGLGCREMLIDGRRGSLICFQTGENGLVHLVIFRREDISGEFPPMDRPLIAQSGGWNSARWEQDGRVYLLLGKAGQADLPVLF